tara:strand:+ start:1746 stop:2054 length:309 start_codon:yes stop_codon:yes gene_type:complete
MIFLSKPSVYTLPGTWEKQDDVLIPHLHLTPDQGFILFIVLFLFTLVGIALYNAFGPGSKNLKDQIDEHAKLHELGIAHGHEGRRAVMKSVNKDYPKHSHDD